MEVIGGKVASPAAGAAAFALISVDANGRIIISPTPGKIILRNAADDADIAGDAANGLDVDVTRAVVPTGLGTVASGELAGSVTAIQMPNVACRLVKFKAHYDNAGRVYIGGSGVTTADGTTDITTGLQLSAGEETGWIPISNLNLLYRICDNAGDDLTYIALS